MEIRKLLENLRQKAEINPHQGLLLEAADKIEWLQKLIDDMTNDHFVDTLDFYSERCQNLEKDFIQLVMQSPEICNYCQNHIICKGKNCPKYIEGEGCWIDDRCHRDWAWSCRDFDFGTCDMLENTPCNGCIDNDNKGFVWRGESKQQTTK